MDETRDEQPDQVVELPEGFTDNHTPWDRNGPVCDWDKPVLIGITADDDVRVHFNSLDGEHQADRYLNKHTEISDTDEAEEDNDTPSKRWWGGDLRQMLRQLPMTITPRKTQFGKQILQYETDPQMRDRLGLSNGEHHPTHEEEDEYWALHDELKPQLHRGKISYEEFQSILEKKHAELHHADPIPPDAERDLIVHTDTQSSYKWAYHVTNNDIKP